MSVLQAIRKNSKMLGKGTLYIGGALAMSYPLIKGGQDLMRGSSVEHATVLTTYEATGYHPETGKVDRAKLGAVVARNIVGVAAIYTASKL